MIDLTIIFIPCLKQENLSQLCKGLFRDSVRIALPEKNDREDLLRHFMKDHNLDFSIVAKYLQGKTSFEIRQLVKVLLKQDPKPS